MAREFLVICGSAALYAASFLHAAPQSACSTAKSVCGGPKAAEHVALAAMSASILETAEQAGSFKTLLAAIDAAGLEGALSGDGPFTVFAPTDAAFAKLPKETLASLLKPENKAKLASILTYHVLAGEVAAADVVRMSGATTLNGQRIDIAVNGGSVTVDGAVVSKTDIVCGNGVIHVIDSVILPASEDIVATAQSAGMFSTLLAAAKAAGLVDVLKSEGPLTVLAPTDEAFARLPKGTVENLLKPENKDQLASILKYHVIPGRVYVADAVASTKAATALGQQVVFSIREGRVFVDGASVIATDLDASNGVVHVIDRVILPASK